MELKLAQTIVKLLEDINYEDFDDVSIYENYNYTYNKTTTGITGIRLAKLIAIVIENADKFVHSDIDCLELAYSYPIFDNVGTLYQDQLGLTTIIY